MQPSVILVDEQVPEAEETPRGTATTHVYLYVYVFSWVSTTSIKTIGMPAIYQ